MNAPGGEEPAAPLVYVATMALALIGLALVGLTPFATLSKPHRVAGILFRPWLDGRASVEAIVRADRGARLVDMRWDGRLIFVVYDDATFPALVRKAGAVYLFDAGSAGCHFAASGRRDPLART